MLSAELLFFPRSAAWSILLIQRETPRCAYIVPLPLTAITIVTYRGNRGIELNKSNFDELADVLYYDYGWEAWEIDSRLKHYEDIKDHDWA